MTLIADGAGVVRGKFTIPANLPAGTKSVSFVGSGGQSGQAIFSGQGTIERQRFQKEIVTTVRQWSSPPPPPPPPIFERGVDPLAQTFSLSTNTQVSGIDLWFSDAPTTQTNVQIRGTSVGFPDQTILADVVVNPASIVTSGAHTRVLFSTPVLLLSGVEYAVVILCGDAVGAMSVAEIGKFDSDSQKWITNQPYSVGVLLSSSNASTWTAHQDRDLTFRLLGAEFTSNTRTISLGNVAVSAITDLMLMSYAERPNGATDVKYVLTLPDASVITVDDGQSVQLLSSVTGNIAVSAILSGTSSASPVLHPGTQLVAGVVGTTADYVTRAIPGGSSVKVKVIYEAFVPSGATVTVQYKGPDGGDVWATLPQIDSSPSDDGFFEFIHEQNGVNEASVQIKIILSGTPAARPRVRQLRTFVM